MRWRLRQDREHFLRPVVAVEPDWRNDLVRHRLR
jgi:hypothetical protein